MLLTCKYQFIQDKQGKKFKPPNPTISLVITYFSTPTCKPIQDILYITVMPFHIQQYIYFLLLFFNAEFSRNYMFEMLKFNQIIREGKVQRLVEALEPIALR
jgi:hypothetical protein